MAFVRILPLPKNSSWWGYETKDLCTVLKTVKASGGKICLVQNSRTGAQKWVAQRRVQYDVIADKDIDLTRFA